MKIAAFVLSLLSVSGQTTDGTPDERRKNKPWKTTEPATLTTTTTEATTTTTTTTTTTEATTTTSTTTQEPTESPTQEPTKEYVFEAKPELDGDKKTKELQQLLAQPPAEVDPDILAINNGFVFGNGLETKGPILDETQGPSDGNKGGKKKNKGSKGKDDDVEDEDPKKKKKKDKKKDKAVKEKPKKKKVKDGDEVEPGCNVETLYNKYNMDTEMKVEVFKKKKGTAFQISCDNGDNPNFNFVTCKEKKGIIDFDAFNIDFGRKKKKVKKLSYDENSNGVTEIFCSQFGGTKNTDQCTQLKFAKKAARNFGLTPKQAVFENYSEHSHKWEVTVACNQKFTTHAPQSGVLLLECTGFPKMIDGIETYWYPSLTSVTDFTTFQC